MLRHDQFDDGRRMSFPGSASASEGSTPSDVETVQGALAKAIHEYAELVGEGHEIPPIPPDHEVTQTEIVLVTSRLLRAAEIELFELAMWQIAGEDDPSRNERKEGGT